MRRPALLLAAFAATALVLMPTIADAQRRGGSFGSRGTRTYQAPPPTRTAPNTAQPMQRSVEQPGRAATTAAPGAAQRAPGAAGGFFSRSPLMAGLMGGLLGMGIFGLLSGSGLFGGFGGLASILGLLIQIGLIVLVVRLALGWYRRRQAQSAPAMAGAAGGVARDVPPGGMRRESVDVGGAPRAGAGGGVPTSDIQVTPADFEAFERILKTVNQAWSHQDEAAMRAVATPEVLRYLGEDIGDLASRGLRNETSATKLEQGDLAEAWREGAREFATVSMRYSFIDVTRRISDGEVVEGDPGKRTEATELWTFVRIQGGDWKLSAIQQTS
jgi:predicted lipid-binding transport protein (Tim44 family)